MEALRGLIGGNSQWESRDKQRADQEVFNALYQQVQQERQERIAREKETLRQKNISPSCYVCTIARDLLDNICPKD